MTDRKVYGSLNSPNTLKPFGQVPVYEDDGIKQFESRAIIRGMGHEYAMKGEELIFWDPKKQAVIANWIDVEDHWFEPPASELIFEMVIKPKKGLAPDQETLAEAEAKLSNVLDVYEARLAKFKYLAADKYTIADVLHLPNLQSLVGTPAKKLIESRPRVKAWCSEILARPAWAKVLEMKHKTQAQASSISTNLECT
ncbi:hypothetical protein I3843_07G102700 [Carya illinoinensis]|uniref:glutathione transferase n=1 Tax=Carya illinoinensis TaxID=32201 RepID=A0A8T1Q0Z9_CARIL|nr:glutathione S-transferase-like [Carya illinoinensis]KAG6647824.1 hypothetical protein CIPAW_07G105000 [Carya illinoinensis]KAG7970804.1 hypothetical protein I3843_07G102700 [Carya illinoinensis]